jgi:hypothetical protein
MLHDPQYKKARRQHLTTTKLNNNPDWSPFRVAEKRYKARFPPLDLSNVLDLATLDPVRTHEIQQGFWSGRSDIIAHKVIHLPDRHIKAYTISCIPGAAFSGPLILISISPSIRTCLITCFCSPWTTTRACAMVPCWSCSIPKWDQSRHTLSDSTRRTLEFVAELSKWYRKRYSHSTQGIWDRLCTCGTPRSSTVNQQHTCYSYEFPLSFFFS